MSEPDPVAAWLASPEAEQHQRHFVAVSPDGRYLGRADEYDDPKRWQRQGAVVVFAGRPGDRERAEEWLRQERERWEIKPGTPCGNCGEHEASTLWLASGSELELAHGGADRWCFCCALRAQIEHAEKAAARLPGLRDQLASADCAPVP